MGFLHILVMEANVMVSSKGGKYGFVFKSRQRAYKGIRRKTGLTKGAAARISNAGRTHAARVRMAKKGARTRKLRRGGSRRR